MMPGLFDDIPDAKQPEGTTPAATSAFAGLFDDIPDTPDTTTDVLKSVGSGIVKGVAGVAGLPGDIGLGMRWLNDKVKQQFGYEHDPEYVYKGRPKGTPETFFSKASEYIEPPTTSDVIGSIEGVVGPLYKPQTTAGKYAGTVGEFLPGAVSPGNTAKNLVKFGLIPGVTSEAAGQLTEGAPAEPYARLVGAILGGGVGSALDSPPKVLPPAQQAQQNLSSASERLGVPIPVVATPGRPVSTLLAGKLKEVPGVGEPLRKAARETTEGLGEKAKEVAESIGTPSAASAAETAATELKNWVTTKSDDLTQTLYSRVDKHINKGVRQPLTNLQNVVKKIQAEQLESTSKAANSALGLVEEAVSRADGLTYEGIKQLRTDIGSMISGKVTPAPGTSQPALKRLYGALTEDLKESVRKAGGKEGIKAWEKANRLTKEINSRRDNLIKIVGAKADASPTAVMERIESLAGTKSKADLDRLFKVKKALSPDAWKDMTATIVSKLGRDPTQPADYFSPERFLTSYSKFSDGGKTALFGGARKTLDDIATVSQQHRELARLGNPPGTGGVVTTGAGLYGLFNDPLSTIGAAVGGNVLSRILARPSTAKKVLVWSTARYNMAKGASDNARQALLAADRELSKALSEETGEKEEDIRRKLM